MDDSTRTVSAETMRHYCRGLAILECIVEELANNHHDSTPAMQKAFEWVRRDKSLNAEPTTLATAGVE